MDFLEASLGEIAGISIHFSSDCNMACKYCYIEKDKKCMAAYNRGIRQALEEGSFAAVIKEKCASIRPQIENLSLWGAEPTINSKLFKDFIYELLEYFPNVNSLMFSTNALLGADLIYNDFFIPLMEFSEKDHRKFTFQLQLSLDGPPEYNDDSRHEGATAHTLETMRLLLQKLPKEHPYFTLEISTKATLDVYYMRKMIEGGPATFQWYFDFFDSVATEGYELSKGKTCCRCFVGSPPTLVDPGYHTVDDGKVFAQWIHSLRFVDRSHFKTFEGPLFVQAMNGIETILGSVNPLADSINAFSCSASKNNISIDHEGNLYTCNRLCRNAALSDEFRSKHSMQSNTTVGGMNDKTWLKHTWGSFSFHDNILSRWEIERGQMFTLAQCGQILPKYARDEDEQKMLFFALIGLTCHIGCEEDYTQNPFLKPYSYYRYLGNGALDELIEYYKLEVLRGNMRPWKIAM